MAIHYRKRGKVWHVRGTIRVGRQVVRVPEHSTGCSTKAEAEIVGAAEEARVRAEALDGTAPRARIVTIGECIAAYRARPGDHHPFDEARLNELVAATLSTKLPNLLDCGKTRTRRLCIYNDAETGRRKASRASI